MTSTLLWAGMHLPLCIYIDIHRAWKIKSNFLAAETIYKGKCGCWGFFLSFPFIVMMHFMISLLYSILSNDTFYQFSGEYWCFALLNMSFDFFDVLLLLSICFLVMLSFGGNFSLSPQRFFPGVALSLFFSPLVFGNVWHVTQFLPWEWGCSCAPHVSFRDFSMQSTFSCLQDPWGFNQRTIFKSKWGEKPTVMF